MMGFSQLTNKLIRSINNKSKGENVMKNILILFVFFIVLSGCTTLTGPGVVRVPKIVIADGLIIKISKK